jgi:branched-chain amino acid transport system permease protein
MYFITSLLVLGCINGIMVVGLNLQYGYSGLLNFAYYTYVAVGAYIAAVTTMGPSRIPGVHYILGWHLPWYLGILLGGIVAAALGAVVFSFTVRRLRSDYLAIVTVAAAFIFYNIVNTKVSLFDGANGLFNVPYITGSANLSIEQYSLIVLVLAAVLLAGAVWVSRRIFRSPYGRLPAAGVVLPPRRASHRRFGKLLGRAHRRLRRHRRAQRDHSLRSVLR